MSAIASMPVGSVRPLTVRERQALDRFALEDRQAVIVSKAIDSPRPASAPASKPDNSCFDSLFGSVFAPVQAVAKQATQVVMQPQTVATKSPLIELLEALAEFRQQAAMPVSKAARSNPNDVFGDFLPRPLNTVNLY